MEAVSSVHIGDRNLACFSLVICACPVTFCLYFLFLVFSLVTVANVPGSATLFEERVLLRARGGFINFGGN